MRTIRVGDDVQAFLSPLIKGKVVETKYVKSNDHMIGGTATQTMVCIVQLADGTLKECKASDLFHL
jgi:hypothetical protein